VPSRDAVAVANAVATALALLERVAQGDDVSQREWVDATCALIESVPATVAADADSDVGGSR
jgi:hypothetical protein